MAASRDAHCTYKVNFTWSVAPVFGRNELEELLWLLVVDPSERKQIQKVPLSLKGLSAEFIS